MYHNHLMFDHSFQLILTKMYHWPFSTKQKFIMKKGKIL